MEIFFPPNILLRLNQSGGHVTGTMTPANSWRLFIRHYVPVLDRFQARCRNRPGVRREKRPSAVSVRGTSWLSPNTFSWNFVVGDFYEDKAAYFFWSLKWAKMTDTFMNDSLQLSRWRRDFPHLSRQAAVRPTQPPIQWLPGLSQGESGRGVALTTHPI